MDQLSVHDCESCSSAIATTTTTTQLPTASAAAAAANNCCCVAELTAAAFVIPLLSDDVGGAKFASRLSVTVNSVLASYLTAVGIFSLAINSLSIYSTFGRRRIKLKPVEHFMLALNIADMGMVVFTFPFAISSFFARRWLFGEAGCAAVGFLSFLWGIQNLMTVVILAAMRFVAVCYPQRESRLNLQTTVGILVASVIYSIIWSAMPLGIWGSYAPEPYGTSCTIDWANLDNFSYVLSSFLFVFLIPFVVIIGCYASIYRVTVRSSQLAHAASAGRQLTPSRAIGGAAKVKIRKRLPAAKLGILLSASYFVCWFPYAVVSFWAAVADASTLPPIATALPVMLAKTSVLFNPILYLLTNRRFRQRLVQISSSSRSSALMEMSQSSKSRVKSHGTGQHIQERTQEHTQALEGGHSNNIMPPGGSPDLPPIEPPMSI